MFDRIKISQVEKLKATDLMKPVDTTDTFKYSKIWQLVEADEGFRTVLEALMRFPLAKFIEESKKDYTPVNNGEVTALEVYYSFTNWGDGDLEAYWAFHGKGDGEPNYALDFTPVNELMHLDVGFAKSVIITGKQSQELNGIPTPTVLDVFTSILEEATFHGMPSSRDARRDDLLQRIKDIDEGKAKFVPWEDVKKQLKKKVHKWAATADQKRKSSKKLQSGKTRKTRKR